MPRKKLKTVEQRFLDKVEKTENCWNWKGSKYYNGYGQFNEGANKIVAHRYSYKQFKGEVPSNLLVCHTCDNRQCVNPDHLFLGTHSDNMRDMISKGRQVKASKVGELNGRSKITIDQVNQIRVRYKTEKISAKKLGSEYGISESQTLRIINNESWRINEN